MDRRKILFIYNPVAGRGQIRWALDDVLRIFTGAGLLPVCYPTSARGDAVRLIREIRDEAALAGTPFPYEMVICSGGDGTLDEVMNGLLGELSEDMPALAGEASAGVLSAAGNSEASLLARNALTSVPVGYIPAGSTNDFAVSLGLSVHPLEAARALVRGRPQGVDIGCMDGSRYFVYVAAFGAFTEVSYDTPQEQKNLFGHAAYLFNGIRELGNLRVRHTVVRSKECETEDDYVLGMITNARSVGGFQGITGTGVDLSDGLFEVTLIRMPQTPADVTGIIAALNSGDLSKSACITHFQTQRATFSFDENVSWTLDGEFGGAGKEVVLENKMHGMNIIL